MWLSNYLKKYSLRNDFLILSNKKIQFRDTGIFINSSADGKLVISSDGAGADDITLTGSITATGDQAITGDMAITGALSASGAITVGGTAIAATAAEINRTCDLTGRVVTIVETGAITTVAHSDRLCMLGEVGGNALVTLTLPEATGSGAKFKFAVSVVNTSSYVIVVADTTNCKFIGNVLIQDADLLATVGAVMYSAGATDDTITLNGTTTGGQLGDFIELIDVATDVWFVQGILNCPAGSNTATCFSAAV